MLDLNLDPYRGLQTSNEEEDKSSDNDDIVEYTSVLGAKHGNGCPHKLGAIGLIRLCCLIMEDVLPFH